MPCCTVFALTLNANFSVRVRSKAPGLTRARKKCWSAPKVSEDKSWAHRLTDFLEVASAAAASVTAAASVAAASIVDAAVAPATPPARLLVWEESSAAAPLLNVPPCPLLLLLLLTPAPRMSSLPSLGPATSTAALEATAVVAIVVVVAVVAVSVVAAAAGMAGMVALEVCPVAGDEDSSVQDRTRARATLSRNASLSASAYITTTYAGSPHLV
mmetsp:Transcript_34356/g.68261  ORF Transcript_34356/g.68261 Transcript_34356/m.68261 type:complete len:214 (+) Transcript_34356:62-703(+)